MRPTCRFRQFAVDLAVVFAVSQILLCFPTAAWANPQGGQVVAGQAGIQQHGGTVTVNQTTPRAVINWQGFSIGAGETTRFVQPSASSAVLNRVLGFGSSQLDGTLQANGQVFLINPNGVVIGSGGRIETGGFVASTLNVTDKAFMTDSDLDFSGDSTAGIRNLGTIRADTGDITLIARTVENAGTLQAPAGAVGLAAGNEVLYRPQGAERLFVKSALMLPEAADGVTNTGLIEAAQAELRAAAGNVYTLAVNNGGAVHATGVSLQDGRVLLTSSGGTIATTGSIIALKANGDGGEIRLQAEGDGLSAVNVSGGLEATGTAPGTKGGSITVTGETVTLTDAARVNASGDAGGGLVRIGGDYQGQNTEVANARETLIAEGAEIYADALTQGDGGRVIVWADYATRFLGRIWARGGSLFGDGGFTEVSGHRLDYRGLADLRAPQGRWGNLLLDPTNVFISDQYAGDTYGDTDYLRTSTISNQLENTGSMTISATDSISFESGDITWTTNNALNLTADNGIFIYTAFGGTAPNIIGTNGELHLTARRMTMESTASLSVNKLFVNAVFDGPFGIYGRVTLGDSLQITGRTGACGSAGDCPFLVNHVNNTIPKVVFGDGNGTELEPRIMIGNTTLVNGNGNLTIETAAAGVASWFKGDLTVRSAGDLTLTNYLRFDPVGTGENCILSAEGRFINLGTPLSLFRGDGVPNLVSQLPYVTRMLVFSNDPRDDTGIDSSTWWWNPAHFADPHMEGRIYDKDYTDLASLPAGNWFVYKLAPTVTISPQDATKIYGSANPVLPWTATGVIAGDSLSGAPVLSSTATLQSGVGTYPIAVTGIGSVTGPSGYQFVIDPALATLTVNKALLSITVEDATRRYGQENPVSFSAIYAGLKDWDKDPITGAPLDNVINGLTLYASTTLGGAADVTKQTDVGTYCITRSGSWPTADNYTIGSIWPGQLTITPANLTVTADNIIRRIGDPNPPFSVKYKGLMAWDDPEDANVLVCCGYNSPPYADAAPGVYPIYPSGGWARNYAFIYVPGTFTVKEPYRLVVTADNQSKVYGSYNPDLTVSYTGFKDGDTAAVVSDVQPTTTATEKSAVGTYPISVSGGIFPPYYTVEYVSGQFKITPAVLTVTADNVIRRIGDPNPAYSVTYTGLMDWDDPQDASVLTCCSFNDPPDVNAPAGNYPINPTGGTASNYTFLYVPGTFTIKAPYQLIITADNQSRVYGSTNPVFTTTISGFEDGDTAAAVSGVQVSTTAGERSAVGLYPITPSGGTFPSYYTVKYVSGRLQITLAPLIVTANDLIRRIGDPNPPNSVKYEGLMAWDDPPDASVLTCCSFNDPPDANAPAGTYPITPSGGWAQNYTFTYVPGTFTIKTPYPLIITADDQSKVYGSTSPVFTTTYSGFQDGDTTAVVSGVQTTTTADDRSGVGSYPITPSGGTFPPYYTATYVSGLLKITPRDLHLYAANVTASYGTAPSLTYTVEGLLPGDSLDSAPALSAGGGVVGTYPIYLTGGMAENYTLFRHDGTLTVTPVPLSVHADDATMVEGQPYPFFTATVTGLQYNDTATVLQGLNLIVGEDLAGSASVITIGSQCAIVQSGPLWAANYSPITFTPGVLTIQPQLIITNVITINTKTVDTAGTAGANMPWPTINPPFGVSMEGSEALRYVARNVMMRLGLDPANVNSWLMDPQNRSLMAPALFEFLSAPLKADSPLYIQREYLKTALENQIHEMQIKIAEDAVARYNQWKIDNAKQHTRLEGLFGNLDVPSEDFVGSATNAYINGALSLGALATFAIAFAAGSSTLALPAVIAPFAAKIAGAAASAAGGAAMGASGIVAGVVLAVVGTVVRAVQLTEYQKVEDKYNNLVNNTRNTPCDIDAMLSGDDNSQNQLFAYLLLTAM